jgi:arabinosaccharide transport system substrate-binding protein
LLIALATGASLVVTGPTESAQRPDLIYATFSKEHATAYETAIADFEREHHVRIQLQVVDQRALQGRLQASLQVGADVPDMVELLDGTLGIFTQGPIEDVGFVDLTERVHAAGLDKKLVTSRFGKWSSRGHIFALPQDVHPAMLCYRRDIVEQLGIDVSKLTTWDEFVRVGRQVTGEYDGRRVIDHYMIDLPASEPWALRLLILQKGGGMYDPTGNVEFDNQIGVDVACWYAHQTIGKDRIAFPCAWGQNLAKAMIDGLCLFYICPDWRTAQFEADVPGLSGKLALIPLPAWEPGGPRTSTWGGTGLAITKNCKQKDLAWQLAMHLYYDPKELGPRFTKTNILPPYIPAWSEPQFDEPRPFFSGIKLGRAYAELAPQVPMEHASPYMILGESKLWEAYTNISLFYRDHGDAGLSEFAARELHRCGDDVRRIMDRNVFLKQSPSADASKSSSSHPLPRYSGGGLGRGFAHSDVVGHDEPPPQPSPGVPVEGEERMRATNATAMASGEAP